MFVEALFVHTHILVVILVHRREVLLCPLRDSRCRFCAVVSSVYILGAKGVFGLNYGRLIRCYVKVVAEL